MIRSAFIRRHAKTGLKTAALLLALGAGLVFSQTPPAFASGLIGPPKPGLVRYGHYGDYPNSSIATPTDGRFTALNDVYHAGRLNESVHDNSSDKAAGWTQSFMDMAQQFTAIMMEQIFVVGGLMDAQNQTQTNALLQKMMAEAHRDYQPDVGMCTFGTVVRSLAALDAKSHFSTRTLDLTMAKRETLSGSGASSFGINVDQDSRWEKFKSTYCDTSGANSYLKIACAPTGGVDKDGKVAGPSGGPATRVNKDIDYTRTVDSPYTLNIDFSTGAATTPPTITPDMEDIMSLSRNLFAFEPFQQITPTAMGQEFGKIPFLDMRSVDAIRSVARNSFAHIVGMRASGTATDGNGGGYMKPLVTELGVPATDMDQFLGVNPSYFAQMEVLTHKIYENPQFYTNLYTGSANIARVGTSLQAIKLMQDRDRYESSLRREMLVSLILELNIRDRQTIVGNATMMKYQKLMDMAE